MNPTPTVGQIVLVPMEPTEANHFAHIAPAIITRVWSDTTVNVRVLADGPDMPWRTSVTYIDALNNAEGTYRWTWPPRVEG